MADSFRRAVRVLCLNEAGQVLLLCWRDPVDPANVFWEPPGGGLEAGEDEQAAAVREMLEETGLAVTPVPGRRTVVHRDVWWNGRRHVGPEPFLLATLDPAVPSRPTTLTPVETATLVETRWIDPGQLGSLPEPVEPPGLAEVLRTLTDGGPGPYSTGR